jgi:hypothetical protein
MDLVTSLLQSHLAIVLISVFTVLSIMLAAIANSLQAIGKQVPGWLGKAISIVAEVLHFVNASKPAAPPSA